MIEQLRRELALAAARCFVSGEGCEEIAVLQEKINQYEQEITTADS